MTGEQRRERKNDWEKREREERGGTQLRSKKTRREAARVRVSERERVGETETDGKGRKRGEKN